MRPALQDLDGRHEHFLSAVIEAYTRTAMPVGSRALARQPDAGISAASIRAVLAGLEQLGYVTRPHTSAGRVPTARGYRYYVDRLLRERPLAPGARAEILALAEDGRRRGDAALDLVRRFSVMVRQLTVALDVTTDPGIVFSGARFIVAQPEFGRASCLAPIFELLDEGRTLRRSLGRIAHAGEHIEVWIGEETGFHGVDACALVGVGTRRDPVRAIAILGPTRLDYADVVTRLRALRDALDGIATPHHDLH
jgi:transcriptional regulator of heat shock response